MTSYLKFTTWFPIISKAGENVMARNRYNRIPNPAQDIKLETQRTVSSITQYKAKPRKQLFPSRWPPGYTVQSEQNARARGARAHKHTQENNKVLPHTFLKNSIVYAKTKHVKNWWWRESIWQPLIYDLCFSPPLSPARNALIWSWRDSAYYWNICTSCLVMNIMHILLCSKWILV